MAPVTLPFVLAAMSAVAPGRDHTTLGTAIANVVEAEAPLFRGDHDFRRTESLIVAIAFREGSLLLSVEGDHDCKRRDDAKRCVEKGAPRSFCTMQIHDSSGGSAALNADPEACIRTGLGMVRRSMRACSLVPLAWYAVGGPPERACVSAYGEKISRDRIALAKWIHGEAVRALDKTSFFAPSGAIFFHAIASQRREIPWAG